MPDCQSVQGTWPESRSRDRTEPLLRGQQGRGSLTALTAVPSDPRHLRAPSQDHHWWQEGPKFCASLSCSPGAQAPKDVFFCLSAAHVPRPWCELPTQECRKWDFVIREPWVPTRPNPLSSPAKELPLASCPGVKRIPVSSKGHLVP